MTQRETMSGDGGNGPAPGAGHARASLMAWPFLVLMLGLAVTFAAWRDASRNVAEDLAAEFRFEASKVEERLELGLDTHVHVLRGVKGLFDASDQVGRAEFRTYVDGLELSRRSPGIQGVGFAQLVPAGELARHERAVRAEGFPVYRVLPEGPRDTYSAIVFLEPFTGRNLRAFGFDMLSEPARRMAMEHARETGRAAMSGKVTLVQEIHRDMQAGFLIYVPVYRRGADVSTPDGRRASLVGWAYSPVRMADFMRAFLNAIDLAGVKDLIDVRVYDGDRTDAAGLMFDSGVAAAAAGFKPTFRAVQRVDFGGHHWTLVLTSGPGFEARLYQERTTLIAVAGIAVSVLVAVLFWIQVAARERVARALAEVDRVNRDLRASEETFRVLFETVPIGVCYHDEAGRFLMANPAAERILGASLENLARQPVASASWQCVREDGSAMAAEDLPAFRALRKRETVAEDVLGFVRPDDGRRIWLRVIAIPIEGQLNRAAAYTAFEDISEKKRTEAELDRYRHSLEVLVAERTAQLEVANRTLEARRAEVEDLFNHAPVGYHSLDADGKFVRVNDTELSWLGYAREDMLGRPFPDFVTEAGRLAFSARFPRFKETGHLHGMEFDMVRKDGSILPVVVDATVVLDDQGRFLASRSNVYDNTERKERQRQIDLLNAALARRAEEAEAASRAKSALLANMSHEFRTPMNGIMGMTYLLQRSVQDPDQRKKLDVIGESARHLLGILNNVLDISRLESGQAGLEQADFSLPGVFADSLDAIRAAAEAKGLRVLLDLAPAVSGTVRGDAARLSQVLRNFLANAVKFTDSGGITLHARVLDEGPEDILVRVEVRDTGIGISAEDQGRLFRAFEQVDASSTRAYGGTGLGLAINSRVVQLMGGSLGVDSQVGVGSTFWFVLRFPKAAGLRSPAPDTAQPA